MPNMRMAASMLMVVTGVTFGAVRAQDNRSLPVPEDLYHAVRDNLVRAESVAHLYAFKERRTDVHTNPFGRIGTGGTRVYEVYPSPIRQLTYRRVIERNGVPLTAAELAEQDGQYRTRAAERQRQQAAQTADEQRRREAETARARERRQRRVEDVVNVLQFTLEGRTVYEGVPAFIVSFVPNREAKPTTREGRMAASFQGKVWIAEAASEVMYVEATSIDNISFGFGLVARVGKGAQATMIRRPVPGDVWMPTRISLSGRGRAAVVRTLALDFAVDWFDYRPLSGESATPFLDSRVERESSRGPQ